MRGQYYLLSEAVADAVTRNLVTVAAKRWILVLQPLMISLMSPVHILHVAVVCPLVTHIEGGGDGTPVRIPPDRRLK